MYAFRCGLLSFLRSLPIFVHNNLWARETCAHTHTEPEMRHNGQSKRNQWLEKKKRAADVCTGQFSSINANLIKLLIGENDDIKSRTKKHQKKKTTEHVQQLEDIKWNGTTTPKWHNFSSVQLTISAHLGYDSLRVHQLWANVQALLRLMPPLKNPIIIVCFRLGSLSTSFSLVFKNNYFSHFVRFRFFSGFFFSSSIFWCWDFTFWPLSFRLELI